MTDKQKKILDVAKYIIENRATIADTAQRFEMSISSIKKYINNELPLIDKEIYDDVKKIQEVIIHLGNTGGGKVGKRGPAHTDFEAMEIAETMIKHDLTIEQASEMFDIPKSTLYEMIRRIDDNVIQDSLNEMFERKSPMK